MFAGLTRKGRLQFADLNPFLSDNSVPVRLACLHVFKPGFLANIQNETEIIKRLIQEEDPYVASLALAHSYYATDEIESLRIATTDKRDDLRFEASFDAWVKSLQCPFFSLIAGFACDSRHDRVA